MLAGVGLLVLVQGWGIAFDFLAHVGIKLGPVVSMQAGLAGWRAEFIALAYQMGALIFPSLVPRSTVASRLLRVAPSRACIDMPVTMVE